jgi:DNA-binding transcriptional ArsR family regulator
VELIDQAFKALAEPRRRDILQLVAHDELAAGEIAAAFEVSRTAVSQHLTVLKDAGLLAERPDGLDALRRFLDDMWASSLDMARRLAEGEEQELRRVG